MDHTQNKTLANLLVDDADNEIDTTVPEHLLSIDNLESVPRHVIVDPTVAFKIIKHSREHYPRTVNGQILGLEIKGTVQVTNSFPLPTNSSEDESSYKEEMQNYMQEVNMESSPVGWYSSTRTCNFLQKSTLESMNEHLDSSSTKPIVLIYDSERSEQGSLSLRAFQLSDNYLELYKANSFSTLDLIESKLSFNNVFEELGVQLKTSSLSKVLLSELEYADILPKNNGPSDISARSTYEHHLLNNSIQKLFPALKTKSEIEAEANINSDPSQDQITSYLTPFSPSVLNLQNLAGLEKSMELMIDCIDDYTQDANSWMYWQRGAAKEIGRRQAYVQRKVQENTARAASNQAPLKIESEAELDAMFKTQPEPSRIDSLLNMAHTHGISLQINQVAGPSISRLYASSALQGDSQK
ncbi:Eukaryotic translation initiation factor 3 subunit H [Smittium mucronatum]|uniref:Eukaryotic translation initiation factor 3 subunit H n=1 Tax=Smittium mucronatum TaxID=133383 RepID=A0A1R0H0K4_9FUNG|nr:Eukaryotic translation initiation factor 3 subunit H [Smittium mucronatum]